MRYIVITENQMTGNAQRLKQRILNPCGLTNPKSLGSLTSQTSK